MLKKFVTYVLKNGPGNYSMWRG